MKESNIEFEEVKWNNDAIIIKNVLEEDIRKLKIYENGEIYLQSLSSMIPPVILEPNEKENILVWLLHQEEKQHKYLQFQVENLI